VSIFFLYLSYYYRSDLLACYDKPYLGKEKIDFKMVCGWLSCANLLKLVKIDLFGPLLPSIVFRLLVLSQLWKVC
jgi:hypothetical protein